MFRLSLDCPLRALRLRLNVKTDPEAHFSPSHNIPPGSEHPVVVSDSISIGQWGIPCANNPEPVIFIPMSSFASPSLHRCAIPLDGFFAEVPSLRFFHDSRSAVFFAAAVVDDQDHFALVTAPSGPNPDFYVIEFPIFFAADALQAWEADGSVAPPISLRSYEVMRTPIVAGHTGPECIRPWRLDIDSSLESIVHSACKFRLK
jgi:hypothetical protein